jgi:copper chaperone CopZ
VRKALESLPWAKQVKIDLANKQVTFRAEIDKYDEDAIVTVLKQAGYAGSKVVK